MTKRKYHLAGVAGVGMNPLAQLLLAEGCEVSGSDRFFDQGEISPVLDLLCRHGLQMYPQDGSGLAPGTEALVISTAIESDNPEIAAARKHGIKIMHRAELLAQLAAPHELIGITGTAGKTTVTGMIGWTLENLGADPTVVNGGALLNWRSQNSIGNMRRGKSHCWVLELDESDRSLLHFHPQYAVITNISQDHFELAEVKQIFQRFTSQVRGITLGAGTDGKPVLPDTPAVPDLKLSARGASFTYRQVPFSLQLPGRHNAENAMHCIMLCEKLGYELPAISAALAEFRGIERRLQYVGTAGGVNIFDDYAHNPAKIAAARETLAPWHKRVVTVWRPHGYGPLRLMWKDLLETFRHPAGAGGNPVLLLPVFFAGGTADRRIGSDELAAALREIGVDAYSVADYHDLNIRLRRILRADDALLILGARDPELPRFALNFLADFSHFIEHGMPDT